MASKHVRAKKPKKQVSKDKRPTDHPLGGCPTTPSGVKLVR